MFGSLRRLIGSARVIEDRGVIHIDGIPADILGHLIYKNWSTSKINQFMFLQMSRNRLSFYSFFAPDFLYTLQTIVEAKKRNPIARELVKLIDLLYEHTWLGSTRIDYPSMLDYSKLALFNTNPLPHQREFLEHYDRVVPKYKLKGYMLGADPGTGKTLTGLFLAECLLADEVICIVPKNSVDKVWVDTLRTRYKTTPTYWASSDSKVVTHDTRFKIAHFEALETLVNYYESNPDRIPRCPMIILDESHNFNTLDSTRSQLFIKLCKLVNAKHVVWSSGTLVKAIGSEVATVLYTLDDLFTKASADRFLQIYGKNANRANDILKNRLGYMVFKVNKSVIVQNKVETIEKRIAIPNGTDYTLDSIRAKMAAFIEKQMAFYKANLPRYIQRYFEILKIYESDLLTEDRPEYETYTRYIAMIRKSYDPIVMKEEVIFCNKYEAQIMATLPRELREEFRDAKSVVKYYALKVQGEALGRILGRLRTQCNLDLVEHVAIDEYILEAVKKTVVFTSFVEVVDKVHDSLSGKGFSPLRVYGDTNKNLPAIVKQFDTDENINPLIATFKSLSTAVPLVMASTVIMLNAPFRDHEYKQAVARLDRLGQDSIVTVINVLLDTGDVPNISTRSQDILQWSKEQVNAILGSDVPEDTEISLEAFTDYIEGSMIVDEQPTYARW